MFNPDKVVVHHEPKNSLESVVEIVNRQRELIDALLVDNAKKLGEGMSASVHFLGGNEAVCLKIYKRKGEIGPEVFYLSPDEEMSVLDHASRLSGEVEVPSVNASYEGDDGESFIVMDRLDAVTIDDVIKGRADLPENFNYEDFVLTLNKFIAELHTFGVYHRDLHEGNIMINKKTGKPGVIDFGAGTIFYGEPDPGGTNPYDVYINGRKTRLISDEARSKAALKLLSTHLTEIK